MAGRKPASAVAAYIEPMQRALSCVTKAVLRPTGYKPREEPYALILADARPVKLKAANYVALAVGQRFQIVPGKAARGPWKVSTKGYGYVVYDDGGELIQYHWHPYIIDFPDPHIHTRDTPKRHTPTGRVSLEEVVRMLINDCGVSPIRDDWKEVLAETQSLFEQYRTWPDPI